MTTPALRLLELALPLFLRSYLSCLSGAEEHEVAQQQSKQLLNLLEAQETVDLIDLAPLVTEVAFLVQVREGGATNSVGRWQWDPTSANGTEEDALVSSTALHLAIRLRLDNVAAALIPLAAAALRFASGPRCFQRTPLRLACDLGSKTTAILLLRHGADVDELDNWHRTPLHNSCERGDAGLVRLLLNHGADASVVGTFQPESFDPTLFENATPLEVACAKGYLRIVRLLLKDAKSKVAMPDMRRCLKWACTFGSVAVVQELLE